MYDVAVIGCGVVGAAVACELSRYHLSVAVLERENDVAMGTSRANSAIVHAGYDPEPGTAMAALNVEGTALMADLCRALDVPYRRVGSLVVALSPDEVPVLEALLARGKRNGVPGLELLNQDRLQRMEPRLSPTACAALYAPTTGIVSPWELTLALAQTAVANGVRLCLNSEVSGIRKGAHGFSITTPTQTLEARYIVNAAGVDAQRVHDMVAAPVFRSRPSRGEYFLLDKSEGERVRHVVFQCPGPDGKGVLVAPTVHGNLIVGPNAHDVRQSGDTQTTGSGLAEVAERARRSVPSLDLRQNIRNFAGVRAVCDADDFILAEAPDARGFLDLAGIKSPGLSAAPAIAKRAVELLADTGLRLEQKESMAATRKKIRFHALPLEEKMALARENPAYGRVVCRCETITEGEILDALRSPVPPVSLDGVKRRCGTGMGRCQGGFCGPRVLELIAAESGCSPLEVVQDRVGSQILTGETKGANHCVRSL